MINIAYTGREPRNHVLQDREIPRDRTNGFERTSRGVAHAGSGFEGTRDDRGYNAIENDVENTNRALRQGLGTAEPYSTSYGQTIGVPPSQGIEVQGTGPRFPKEFSPQNFNDIHA